MRRGTQPNNLRPKVDRLVIPEPRPVIESYRNPHYLIRHAPGS